MKICLISSQIAAWGKIGGFGTATRALGRGLVAAGIEVVAVVPRRAREGQAARESLDGITVWGTSLRESLSSGRVFREVDADLYHSQEPTLGSYLAQRARPGAKHVVTCRDPRDWRAHLTELRHASWKRRLIAPASLWYEASPLVKASVRRADAVMTPAPSVLHERIRRLYGREVTPRFIPSPVELPETPPRKSPTPTVLFVGRLDRRKSFDRFAELAPRFPQVRFIAVGRAHDAGYDRLLRARYASIPNLEMTGFIPRFGSPGVLDYYHSSWILVNTSVREGLPYSFLEGAAHGMAILSALDPEGFATRFGRHVRGSDFESGLRWLLEADRWRTLGMAGAEYLATEWGVEASVRRHLELYDSLLG